MRGFFPRKKVRARTVGTALQRLENLSQPQFVAARSLNVPCPGAGWLVTRATDSATDHAPI